MSREENEDVVLSTIESLPNVEVEGTDSPIGDLVDLAGGRAVRFNPIHQADCPGYFIAVLSRK